MRPVDELLSLVEGHLDELDLADDLGALRQPIRYALDGGGKRLRPVLCLAVTEAAGAEAQHALPAALAIELVHTFSLVHDDLPALDDDDERRGRPSVHVAFGEANAILAGDALLAEALRLALSYHDGAVARELTDAVVGMIGGQARDVAGENGDLAALHRLKTGRLFAACVGCALWVAGVPGEEQGAWRAFGDELGPLFQIVDDILDGDGVVLVHGAHEARRLADAAADRALTRLHAIPADTLVLEQIVAGLAARTA
jgi:geranylgeranyl diphosphate synthase, type II